MTKRELYQLLAQPELVRTEHIAPLERLVKAYPYAGSFAQLYLYALAQAEDLRYRSELKRLAAYLPSREHLYTQIIGHTHTPEQKKRAQGTNDPFSLIDDFLQDARSSGEDLPQDLHFSASDAGDYFATQGETSHERTLVETAQVFSECRRLTTPREEIDQPEEEQELFTETLAKIYIQQGKYERALRILESLHLHYPQKNRYFVDQIRYLQRLVQNNSENKDKGQ